MITYNDIYEALRKEKYSDALQPLNKKFILEVAKYLEEKKEIAEKKNDLFSEDVLKTKKQLENAVSIFRELMLRRKKKLLNLSFVARETGVSKRDFDNMTIFEKEMFDKIIKSMEESDKAVSDLMNGKGEEKMVHLFIVFNENVDEFLGLDGEMIGPFDKGDMANLPEKIARILIDSKKAEVAEE
ncbi:MAG: hypothetical protein ABIG37_02875 [Nanoarchaeota archaeon]|nr:hypothetical protein [Nanoarchaeota archaeon]